MASSSTSSPEVVSWIKKMWKSKVITHDNCIGILWILCELEFIYSFSVRNRNMFTNVMMCISKNRQGETEPSQSHTAGISVRVWKSTVRTSVVVVGVPAGSLSISLIFANLRNTVDQTTGFIWREAAWHINLIPIFSWGYPFFYYLFLSFNPSENNLSRICHF